MAQVVQTLTVTVTVVCYIKQTNSAPAPAIKGKACPAHQTWSGEGAEHARIRVVRHITARRLALSTFTHNTHPTHANLEQQQHRQHQNTSVAKMSYVYNDLPPSASISRPQLPPC